jgi:hypothetical protein
MALEIPVQLKDVLKWSPTYHNRKKAILYNFGKTTEHYLITGKLLCDAEEKKDWKHDGSCASNFIQWIENELGFKRTQVQRMMKIWKEMQPLIENHIGLILQIEFSKLAIVSSRFDKKTTEDEKLELLHSAKELSVRSLELLLKENNAGTADVCEHIHTEKWLRCKDCGKFIKG